MKAPGKIIAVLPQRSGIGRKTGTPWICQPYVIETEDPQPMQIPFEVFGENEMKDFNIQLGEELTIDFRINGHEYQGKWYTRISCTGVERPQGAFVQQAPFVPQQAPSQSPQPQVAPPAAPQQVEGTQATSDADDLPFR